MTKEQLKEKLITFKNWVLYDQEYSWKEYRLIWNMSAMLSVMFGSIFSIGFLVVIYLEARMEDTFNTNKQNHNVIVVTCEETSSSATEPFGIATYEGYYVGQFETSRFTLLDRNHNEIVFVNRKCTVIETRTNRQ